MNYIQNPILPGFHPDPSICYANGKFYIVTSTFSYFPGVPIYESEDLQHFKLLGNILNRREQLPLMGCEHSQGIFAPTIRFHDGMFYMITTNVSYGGNFVVTAANPEGPWSTPFFIEGAEGIDPSLFFDDDGSCYYIGTRPNPEGVQYNGDWMIYIQRFDTEQMRLVGDYKIVWNGALKNAVWPEGPHIYQKDGYYYLMHAEGGTGPSHAITIARSRSVWGPYEGCPNNPVFSHRYLGKDYPVQNVGHSDMVSAANGNWYAVMLASRPISGHTTLGRETFLADVAWEDGWPVINPGEGKLYAEHPIDLPRGKMIPVSNALHFNSEHLDLRLVGLRLIEDCMYSLTARKDFLRLHMRDIFLAQTLNPSYLGIRQQHQSFMAEAMLDICFSQENDSAGLAIVQSNEANLQLLCQYREGALYVIVLTVVQGIETEIKSHRIMDCPSDKQGRLIFKIGKKLNHITLAYTWRNSQDVILADDINGDFLSTESAGGFVGGTVGMYAAGIENTKGYADFGWFVYEGL